MTETADEILQGKIKLAKELAGKKGFLTRKEFAYIAEIQLSRVSGLIKQANFGKVVRKKTGGGRGPVKIPLATVLKYVMENFSIE
jgi:hypothetical protein